MSLSPRRFVLDTLGMAASQYVARAVLLARGVLAAAALGPAAFGGWNALNLILDYGSYAPCGALQGLDLRLPAPTARGEAAEARRLLAGAWSVIAAGGALFTLAIVLSLAGGHPALLRGLGWTPLLLVLAAVLLQLALQYHGSALRARARFDVVSGSAVAQALVGGGLGLALVWRFGLVGLLWGWLAGTLVGLAWVRLAAPDVPLRPGPFAGGLALARAGFLIFASFAASLVLRSVDRLALIRYGTSADLGAYSLGVMAAGLVLYLPEAAGAVVFPRVAAAAGGARDPAGTRAEVARAQRALVVTLPLLVGLIVVWAAPLVGWLLPAYLPGVPAVRFLALGSLMLSAGTLPGYYLLACGKAGRLLVLVVATALLNAALVFGVAARDHRPAAVALAASAGYAVFALGNVGLAARDLCATAGARAGFLALSFAPAVWVAVLALGACAVGSPEAPGAAGLRTLVVLAGYLPALWWFGRGARLGEVVRALRAPPPPAG